MFFNIYGGISLIHSSINFQIFFLGGCWGGRLWWFGYDVLRPVSYPVILYGIILIPWDGSFIFLTMYYVTFDLLSVVLNGTWIQLDIYCSIFISIIYRKYLCLSLCFYRVPFNGLSPQVCYFYNACAHMTLCYFTVYVLGNFFCEHKFLLFMSIIPSRSSISLSRISSKYTTLSNMDHLSFCWNLWAASKPSPIDKKVN